MISKTSSRHILEIYFFRWEKKIKIDDRSSHKHKCLPRKKKAGRSHIRKGISRYHFISLNIRATFNSPFRHRFEIRSASCDFCWRTNKKGEKKKKRERREESTSGFRRRRNSVRLRRMRSATVRVRLSRCSPSRLFQRRVRLRNTYT